MSLGSELKDLFKKGGLFIDNMLMLLYNFLKHDCVLGLAIVTSVIGMTLGQTDFIVGVASLTFLMYYYASYRMEKDRADKNTFILELTDDI